jgi:hypothetical protein
MDYTMYQESNSIQVEMLIANYIMVDGEANMILNLIHESTVLDWQQSHSVHCMDYIWVSIASSCHILMKHWQIA